MDRVGFLRDFGAWGHVVRELANHDPDRYPVILKYRAGEALLAFESKLRQEAAQDYRLAVQVWAALAATGATKQRKPPEPPAILKG